MTDINYGEFDLNPSSLVIAAEDLYELLTEENDIQKIRYSPGNSPRVWHEGCKDPLELGVPDNEQDREKLATMLYIIHQKTDAKGYIRSEKITTKHQRTHGSEHQRRVDEVLNNGLKLIEDGNDKTKVEEEAEDKELKLFNVEVEEETYDKYGSLSEGMKESVKDLAMLAEGDGYIETHEIRNYIDSNDMDWEDLAETDNKIYDEIGLDLRIDYPRRVARKALVEKKELEEELEELKEELGQNR